MTAVPVPDAWQARSDRLARLLLLPILGVATTLAVLGPSDGGGPSLTSAHGLTGTVAVAVAACWSAALIRYPVTGVPGNVRAVVFCVHILLSGVLVWANPWFGVFAFSCYFFADELEPDRRKAAFVLVAAVLSASQTNGYPVAWDLHTVIYLVMVAFNVTAVLFMVGLLNRVLEQNTERGRMIDDLGEANRRLQESMAENAGLHAQLLVQAREAGIVEERQRLAGEIHDTLAQGLTGIITQLEAARRARHDEPEWNRHLDLADSLARANLTEARRSVRALRPEQLERATLPEAIEALARSWSEQSAIAAEVETTGIPAPMGTDVEAALFRVAQEALANVGKHARATQVHLTLSYLDDMLLLDVADDGVGFTPADETAPAGEAGRSADEGGPSGAEAGSSGDSHRSGGYGLPGMRRRLERLSGNLNVESTPGYGTTVNAAVPVRDPALGAVR
ncbi:MULTISPECIES: sensor histidine kinase [Streptacidiphilus]|uniref:Sensor histidine kinase n=1 Tax=Streptacidiphilus cavernicola TaxID=3342716 RepID=A0ABV6UFN1_9ACTN|nr:sensor histidine kinase [Streptacidiphilus jeojiense]